MSKNISIFFIISILALMTVAFSAKYKNHQPVLGTRNIPFIEVKGLKFKDLNKNGKLDPYEDWRLSSERRTKDLLSRMSLEEKVGFMLINSANMVGSRAAEASGGKLAASDLAEGGTGPSGGGGAFGFSRNRTGNADSSARSFQGRPRRDRQGIPGEPNRSANGERIAGMNSSAGTTKMVKEFHMRHFILRANESAGITAEWSNKLQALCEGEPLGIPAIIASNPRNNITTNASLGTSTDATVFTAWPGELGLSAMRDLSLTREFADISRQEWLAVGLRKGYMYMADLSTEPRWSRVNGTFGENAEWVARMIREVIKGFQGEKINNSSVALTTKHFPGGGSGEKGQDSHFDWGKKEIYPGGMFRNNLIPFKAAIKAGTSAIMPYYSMPYGTPYEEVGYAFNRGVLHDILRKELGFKGIINSDTGPIDNMPWGVEKLTLPERYKKALEAGVNLFSGISDPSVLLEAVKSRMIDEKLIDDSVFRLLKEKFELGLFENPYVDTGEAEKIVNNNTFRGRAALALRKSIVLLRNINEALPLKRGTKVYFESLQRGGRNGETAGSNIYYPGANKYDVVFVRTPDEADMAILWIQPSGNSLFASTGAPISLSLSKCNVDVEHVNSISEKKPTVLVINYTNPWVINEIYNDKTRNIAAVLATFGTTAEALLDVITGKFNPSGKMPFSTPVSDQAVDNQKEDVPGYLEGPGYALFNYDEGLNYAKK